MIELTTLGPVLGEIPIEAGGVTRTFVEWFEELSASSLSQLPSLIDFGADPEGVEDSSPAMIAAKAALGVNGALIIPAGSYYNSNQYAGADLGFLRLGPQTLTGQQFVGTSNQNVKSPFIFQMQQSQLGNATMGSANQFLACFFVESTGAPTASSVRNGIYSVARQWANSDYSNADPALWKTHDLCAVSGHMTIVPGVTTGRGWALHAAFRVLAGADGMGYGLELEVYNEGSDQPLLNTPTSKYGAHIVAGDGLVTCGILFNANRGVPVAGQPPLVGKYQHMIHANPVDIEASGSFITLLDKFAIGPTGHVAIGQSAADATIPLLVTSLAAGAAEGPVIATLRDKVAAANDLIGAFKFLGKDSAGNRTNYGGLSGIILSPTDGAEISAVRLQVMDLGVVAAALTASRYGTYIPAAAALGWNGRSQLISPENGRMQARNNANDAFSFLEGKLRTDSAFVATPITPTGYITLYDSTGAAVRVQGVLV